MLSSFFYNETATTDIYTLSLHDALPISRRRAKYRRAGEDEEPLLVGPLEVIRADRLAGRQLVNRHAHPRGSDPLAERDGVAPEALGRLVGSVLVHGAAEDVEDLHAPRLTAVAAHQPVGEPVLLHVADVPEAGLLECAPGAAVSLLDECERSVSRHLFLDELRQDLGTEPAPGQLLFSDEQVDLRLVRLDHPGRPTVDEDDVPAAHVLSELALDRLAPPEAHVIALEPRAQQRQVALHERTELDHARRKRDHTDASVASP